MKSNWIVDKERLKGKPVATYGILAAIVAVFLAFWFMSGGAGALALRQSLAYSVDFSKPWTFFTYPFAPNVEHPVWMALEVMIVYQFLSDIERRIGALATVFFFFAMTVLGGIGYFVGSFFFGGPSSYLPSLELPVECIVFTWCLVNPSAIVRLFFVLPVATRVLMWLAVAGIVIQFGWGNFPVGVLAAVPLGAAWLYATDRVPWLKFGQQIGFGAQKEARKKNQEFTGFLDKVKDREKERAEKEKLRQLFEKSLDKDDKEG